MPPPPSNWRARTNMQFSKKDSVGVCEVWDKNFVRWHFVEKTKLSSQVLHRHFTSVASPTVFSSRVMFEATCLNFHSYFRKISFNLFSLYYLRKILCLCHWINCPRLTSNSFLNNSYIRVGFRCYISDLGKELVDYLLTSLVRLISFPASCQVNPIRTVSRKLREVLYGQFVFFSFDVMIMESGRFRRIPIYHVRLALVVD